MKTTPEDRIDWYRVPVDKDTMTKLTARSDGKAFRHVLSHMALVIVTGVTAFYAWRNLPLPVGLLAIYLHGMAFVYLGEHAAIHELSHGTVFKTRFWNTFFLRLIAFFTWSNYVKYRASHMKHHQLTVHTGLDLEVVLPAKLTAFDWVCFFTWDAPWLKRTFFTVVRHAFGIVSGEWEHRLFPESDKKARRELFWWARIVLIGHLAMAGVFIAADQWILLVLVTFGSTYASWLAWLTTLPQHAGLRPDVNDFRLCCRSVKVNPLVAFLHWNMDYHVEHHMYAAVPFYNLPALHRELKDSLPAMKGLWGTWTTEILPTLNRQRTDPSYVFTPPVPEGTTHA
jgi:fatty acid desaturase